jgi:hypothetical protein
MVNYQDAITILEAYLQLERGHRVLQLKNAAKRVRALDPGSELLPELESKIAQLTRADRSCIGRTDCSRNPTR